MVLPRSSRGLDGIILPATNLWHPGVLVCVVVVTRLNVDANRDFRLLSSLIIAITNHTPIVTKNDALHVETNESRKLGPIAASNSIESGIMVT